MSHNWIGLLTVGLSLMFFSCSENPIPAGDGGKKDASVLAKDVNGLKADAKKNEAGVLDGASRLDKGALVDGQGQSCSVLNEAYIKAVEEAHACNIAVSAEQCTVKTKTALDCPCDTFINPYNTDAVKEMNEAQSQWKAKGCQSQGCPPMPCPEIMGAGCQEKIGGNPNQGVCFDHLPD
jgi:hypothetical protein